MNHQIRELMLEAGYAAPEMAERAHKLAQLLIQGCITQIAMIGVSNCEDEAVMWTVERSIETIKEHYGIKQ